MSNGGNSQSPVNPNENVWAEWTKNLRWQQLLHKKAAHKALDIPEDDVIQANRITGVTWKEIAAAGVVGASLLGAGKYLFDTPQTEAPAAATSTDTDTDTISDFEFVEPASQ